MIESQLGPFPEARSVCLPWCSAAVFPRSTESIACWRPRLVGGCGVANKGRRYSLSTNGDKG